ncbi:hypothetical protein F4779DRAFT_622814 [Xylariaceae sp. FL0662B]|nr:hypothetical protein F4779DRAFT_622814 [Xylariaceae sp. FL0662B]
MKLSKVLALPAIIPSLEHLASAVPNVSVVPIGPDCTAYPGYDGRIAGPFFAVADSTGGAVDGISLDAQYYVENGHPWGFVTAPAAASPTNVTMRCANSTLQAQVNLTNTNANATANATEAQWVDVVVSGDPNLEGGMGFAFPEAAGRASLPIRPHWHFVDGRQVPGVYLGAGGVTTFGFVDNWAGVEGEYYLLRLMATDQGFRDWQLGSRDTTGFLRVTYG